MDNYDQQILNKLNKHNSRRANTLNTKFPENESLPAAPIVYGHEIWMDAILIPRSGPNLTTVKALGNGQTYTDETTDIAVIRRYIAAATTAVNSSRFVFYNANLIDAIPSLFLTTGEYTIRLYKNVSGSAGPEIPYKSGDWDVDNAAGILRFYKSADYILSMLGTLPPFVSFWRYIGRRMDTVVYSAAATAESALPIVGGTMLGNIDMNTHDIENIGALTATSLDIGTGNATIATDGSIVCSNLTVNGVLTAIESQTILIGDNTVVVNNAPMGSRDAGYLIERYVSDIVADTPTATNSAQTATSTTIQLHTTSSAADDAYIGSYIKITASAVPEAVGQIRFITGYVGATRIATIDQAWSPTPAFASSYALYSNRLVGHIYSETDDMFRLGYYQRDSQTALEPTKYASSRADYNVAARLLVGTDNLSATLTDGQARIGTTLITTDEIMLNADVEGGDGVQGRRRNGTFSVNRGDPADNASLYWDEAGGGGNWMMRNSGIDYNVAAALAPADNAIAVHYTSPSSGTYNLLSDATFNYDIDTAIMSAQNITVGSVLRVSGIIMGENQILSDTLNYPLIIGGNGTGLVEFTCAPVAQGPYMAINYSQGGTPNLDGYIQFVRGSSTAASLYWNETLDRFTCGLDTDQQQIARLGTGAADQLIPIYNAAGDTLIFDPAFFYDTATGTLNVNNITSTTLTFGVDDGVSFIKDGNIYTDPGMLYNDTTNKLTLTGALQSQSISLPFMSIGANRISTTVGNPSFAIEIFTGGYFTLLDADASISQNIRLNYQGITPNTARDISILFGRNAQTNQVFEWNESAGQFRIGDEEAATNIARIDNDYEDTYIPFYSLTDNKLLATNVTYNNTTSTLDSVNQSIATALSVAQVAISTNTISTVATTDQDLILTADGAGVIQVIKAISYSPSTITLNLDSADTPASNVSIDIHRGLSTAAQIVWNETSDSFKCGIASDLLPVGRVAASVTNAMMPYYDTTANAFVSDGSVSYNPSTGFMAAPGVTTDIIQFANLGDPAAYEGNIVYLDNALSTTFSSLLTYKNNKLGVGATATTHRVEVTGAVYSTTGLVTGPTLTNCATLATTNSGGIVSNTFNIASSSSTSVRNWQFGNTTSTTGNAALAVFLADNTTTINHYLAANNSQISYLAANNGTVVIGGTTNALSRKLFVSGSFEASSIYLTSATTNAIPYFTTLGQISVPTNFVWKQTDQRLGVGTTAPAQTLDVTGTACISSTTYLTSLTSNRIMVIGASGQLTSPTDMRYVGGNVSIGTETDPTEKLEVGGRVSAIDFTGYTLDNSGILFSDGNVITSGAPDLVWNNGNLCMGIGTDQPVYNLHNMGSTNTDTLYINTVLLSDASRNITINNITSDNNKLIWDNTTGRLGINVAIPSTPLDVKATGSNTSGQQIKSSADAVLFSFDQGVGDQGILRVRDESGVEKIRFNSTGDSYFNATSAGLLIGTTTNTNTRKLLVSGSTESTGIIYATNADDATAVNSGSIQSAGGMSLAKNLVIGGLTIGSIPFVGTGKALSEAALSTFFWDNSNSRLGVGTATPAQTLDVSGAGIVRGVLTTTDATAVSALGTAALVVGGGGSFNGTVLLNTLTEGSIPFINSSKIVTQNNTNLFWDNTSMRLGIGNGAPTQTLDVTGTAAISGATSVAGVLSSTNATAVSAVGTAGAIFSGGVSIAGTAAFGGLTSGSIPYINSSKILSQDTARLVWDATNFRLGINTASPSYAISATGTVQGSTGFVCSGNTGLTVVSTGGGTQILNNDITPSAGNLSCQFRFGRNTVTTGDTTLVLFVAGTATANHSFATNNSLVSYMCSNNGTVAIGTTFNTLGYKLLVSGTFGASGAVTLAHYNSTRIPYFGTGGLISDSANLTWTNGSSTLTVAGVLAVTGTASISTSLTLSASTATRIPYFGTGGLISDSANLTWTNASSLLTVTGPTTITGATTLSNYTINHIPYFGTGGLITGSANFTWNESTLAITGAASVSTSLTLSASTATRIPYFGTGGIISDSANLTWTNGSSLLTVTGPATVSGVFSSTNATAVSAVGTAGAVFSGGVSIAGTAAFGGLTAGGVPYINSAKLLAQATGNVLFWDNTNLRLGVNTATPAQTLSVAGTAIITGATTLSNYASTRIPYFDTSGLIVVSDGFTWTKNVTFPTTTGILSVTGEIDVVGTVNAGAVYAGPSTIAASAVLQADSTTQGALIPRMTNAQKLAISSPATGLLVYDTDLTEISYYDGAAWQSSNALDGTPLPITSGSITAIQQLKFSKYLMSMYNNSAHRVIFNKYTHGVTATSAAYFGGVYSPIQNRIYFIPHDQSAQLSWHYYDCCSGLVVAYTHLATVSNSGYRGGVYVPEVNRIYLIPNAQASVSIWHYIDCSNGTVVSYTHGVTAVSGGYAGGAYMATLGRIYMAPYAQGSNANWHYINALTTPPTATAYAQNNGGAATVTSVTAYIGAIHVPLYDRIYFLPSGQTTVSSWHYVTSAGLVLSYTNSSISANTTIRGGAYSPVNDRIYLTISQQAGNSSTWHYISPSTNTITSYTGQTVTNQVYSGAVYSPTKNIIYHVPYANLGTLAYTNCATATMTTYTNPYTLNNGAYQGGVYSPTENKIIFIPYFQATVSTWQLIDEFSSYPVDRGMMSTSTFNKF